MEPSTSERLMRQYCSVCKAQLDMAVVSDASEDGVIWLKCPRCKGILPHMETADGGGENKAAGAATAEPPSEAAKLALDDMDISTARPYTPKERYEVGDVVHHRGWDDYGIVTEKKTLPGNRPVICVRFVEHGELTLIEGSG